MGSEMCIRDSKVTAGGKTHDLDEPFFVLATQNPIEQEGTYPLPEAQLDRFMFNLLIDYPNRNDEISIVESTTTKNEIKLKKVISKRAIRAYQNLVLRVPIAENVVEYAVDLVSGTRPNKKAKSFVNEWVEWGAGPRATQFLILGAKARAILNGRPAADIEDIKEMALPVLRHRVIPNFNAEAEGMKIDDIITKLL